METAAKVSSIQYTRVIYAFIADMIIFNNKIHYFSYLGGSIIIYSCYKIV